MIYSLFGKVLEKNAGEAVIECGGVGYLVLMSLSAAAALPPQGETATVYTHLNVSENDVALYGFSTAEERKMFLMLTSVSGVGPKAGLAILGAMAPQQIVLAVSAGDHKAFTVAPGVGPKLGQRLVLELRDKVARGFLGTGISLADVAAVSVPSTAGSAQQALAALASLGYTQSEAAQVLAGIDSTLPVEEIVRLALRTMGGRR